MGRAASSLGKLTKRTLKGKSALLASRGNDIGRKQRKPAPLGQRYAKGRRATLKPSRLIVICLSSPPRTSQKTRSSSQRASTRRKRSNAHFSFGFAMMFGASLMTDRTTGASIVIVCLHSSQRVSPSRKRSGGKRRLQLEHRGHPTPQISANP